MKVLAKMIPLLLLATACSNSDAHSDEALDRLVEGNKRFMTAKSTHPNRAAERRKETAEGQEPFAVILGCADSRVSPEILFDQGIGDLFIVRVAGNVAGPIEVASIEFATVYLHSSLVLVLGHQNCGAVDAVLKGETKDIEPIADLIAPAVQEIDSSKGNDLEAAIKQNALNTAAELEKNEVLKQLINDGKLSIKAGYYNFQTGQVEIL